ncbi:sigma factor-like helix-turn-helix DNA-binding protein [Micromonospora sp. M12]
MVAALPDRLLDELPAGDADEPETVAVARETIELAYVVAVQHLAPRPRAVLILRDVLGWPAKDVAELLGDSVNSVNSALQRARAGMREHLPAERQDWTGGEGTPGRARWCAASPRPAWPRTSTCSPECCGTTSVTRCRPRRACTSAATRW